MTVGEFKKLMKKIQVAYPQHTIPEETVELWFGELRECDYGKVKKRVTAHIRDKHFFPALSQLLDHSWEETTILQTIRTWEREGAKRIEEEKRNGWKRPAPPWA